MSLAQEMFDASVRVESLIWLPGAVCSERAPDNLRDFLEELDPDRADDAALVPEISSILSDEYFDADTALEYMAGCTGFLVQAACPVRQYIKGDIYASGWGYYHTKWFRLKSEDEIAPTLIAWSEQMAESDRAIAAAEQSEAASC